jgi:hypothetical protein
MAKDNLANPDAYFLHPPINVISTAVADNDRSSVILHLPESLKTGILYSLVAPAQSDCSGNHLHISDTLFSAAQKYPHRVILSSMKLCLTPILRPASLFLNGWSCTIAQPKLSICHPCRFRIKQAPRFHCGGIARSRTVRCRLGNLRHEPDRNDGSQFSRHNHEAQL